MTTSTTLESLAGQREIDTTSRAFTASTTGPPFPHVSEEDNQYAVVSYFCLVCLFIPI